MDELLATRNHATNQNLYDLTAHLGSPIALVDANQQVQGMFTYAAFGATKNKTGSADSRFRFTGREIDSESGLYHYRARAYDPNIGRFLQQDPLPRTPADPRMMEMNYFNHLADVKHPVPGEMPEPLLNMRNAIEEIDDEEESNFTIMEISLRFPLSLGVYTYVFNNPVDTVDPFGLEGKRYYAKGKGGGGRRPGRVKGGGKQNPGRWHGQPKGPKWGGGPKGGPPLPQPKPGGGEGKPWPYPWPLPLGGEVGEHG